MLRKLSGSILSILCCACADTPPKLTFAPIGDPLPDLTSTELARFEAGALVFRRIFTEQDGLGPRFNENACNACHTDPADGGTGEQLVVKASRIDDLGTCDLMTADGGPNLRRRVTPAAAETGALAVPVPELATHGGRFTTPFLFGAGMIDAIDLSTLEGLADPDDADRNGISGRIGRDAAGRPARFGRKASVATLADFADEAFRLEMGITTPRHPTEAAAGSLPAVAAGTDRAPDPEIDQATLQAVVDFVRFLAPPSSAPDTADLVMRGAELFGSLGCSACHVPMLQTGEQSVQALSNRLVALYSDLLLHDMGQELTGPCASGAAPQEYRTEPLMGLRYRQSFLHDGRARRVRDAILMHGGEASLARNGFVGLDRVLQEAVLEFLGTL